MPQWIYNIAISADDNLYHTFHKVSGVQQNQIASKLKSDHTNNMNLGKM